MSNYDALSDDELLIASRRDAQAFACLYDRHSAAIGRFLEHRAGADASQELFAETFAQAWCSRRRFRPGKGPARGWLFGIAQHLLHQYYRRHAVEDRGRRRLGVVVDVTPAGSDEAHARADAAALRAELADGLASLGTKTSQAVLLRVVDDLSYEEIAAALGCSSQAARLRVSRGLRALKRRSEQGADADPKPVTKLQGAQS